MVGLENATATESATMAAHRLRRSPVKQNANGLHQRVARLEAVVNKLTRARVVRREEHDEVLAALRQLEQNTRDLAIQFKRIAQLQADFDTIRQAWGRMKL